MMADMNERVELNYLLDFYGPLLTEHRQEVMRLYCEEDLSQQEIARETGLSRPYISKLLAEARETGIVEIRIHDPLAAESPLEEQLRTCLGLDRAIVLPIEDEDPLLLEKLGKGAAEYVSGILENGDVLGVAWGSTLYALSRQMPPRQDLSGIRVVQLAGGVACMGEGVYASDIPRNIAAALGGECHIIPFPAIMGSREAQQAVLKDSHIRDVLELGRKARVAVFTAGVFSGTNVFVRAGYLKEEEIDDLFRKGAAGDICSHILGADGQVCDPKVEERTLALSLEDIARIPERVCVAAGSKRAGCVMTAIRMGYVTTLVTNGPGAMALLALHQTE